MRRPPSQPPQTRWALSAFLALACHALLLGLLALAASWLPPPAPSQASPPPPPPFGYVPLSTEAWQKNRGESLPASPPAPPLAKASPPPKKAEPEKPFPNKQLVDVAPGNRQVDNNAEYLAETHNRVEKQTRAKHQTPHYKNAAPQTTSTEVRPAQGEAEVLHLPGNMGLGVDDRPLAEGAAARAALEIPVSTPQAPLSLQTNPLASGPAVPSRKEREAQPGNSERLVLGSPHASPSPTEGSLGRIGNKTGLLLAPSYATLDKISGAAPNDFLPDVEAGEGTFLNTKEWKYASFFNRLKQKVGQNWHPNAVLQARDLGGNIFGNQDRFTLLSVRLNKMGQISGISVAKSSGLRFLDDEAVAAFNRAAPFLNPPHNMFLNNEDVHFSFGFYLEFSSGGLSGFLGRVRTR